MCIKDNVRYSSHIEDYKNYSTLRLREEFLVDKIFEKDKILLTYSYFDRFIIGGIMPISKILDLKSIDLLQSECFCDRREVGIINIGGSGTIKVDETTYRLEYKEALYIGKDTKRISLASEDAENPAKFYLNSSPAHKKCSLKKITRKDAIIMDLGESDKANVRQIIQYMTKNILETCQLQMGITELEKGSIWNTMPPHTHDRRMEAYFYSGIKEGQAVCHFMGDPENTRHIWVDNDQAVISPSWSIHAGAGTQNYFFIWGMAGENIDFTDMDLYNITDIR